MIKIIIIKKAILVLFTGTILPVLCMIKQNEKRNVFAWFVYNILAVMKN